MRDLLKELKVRREGGAFLAIYVVMGKLRQQADGGGLQVPGIHRPHGPTHGA
jgi:hypothetical protein